MQRKGKSSYLIKLLQSVDLIDNLDCFLLYFIMALNSSICVNFK